jgi:hypothetical protein
MASKYDLSFEDFAALCPDVDMSMFDMNGVVLSQTIGFNFSVNEDDPDGDADWMEMAELFSPIAILAGTTEMQDRIKVCGHTAFLMPYFEGGGFMVVLKVPVELKIMEKK